MRQPGLHQVAVIRHGRQQETRVLRQARQAGLGRNRWQEMRQPRLTKQPSYGIEGSNNFEFCAQHAKQGMVDVRHKKCPTQGCTKKPSYGVAGSKKTEFCAQHAKQGMVDLDTTRRCANHGCSKNASYGTEGSKKREFCTQHAEQGMVDVSRKRCANQGCTKQASYGIEGSKKREFCNQHAEQGMVGVIRNKCANQGCTKHPSYGMEGSEKRVFCSQHAKQGMVIVGRKEECTRQGFTKRSSLGMEGSKTRDICLPYPESSIVRLESGSSFGVSSGGVRGQPGNPPVNGVGSRVGLAAGNREANVETSITGTNSPGIVCQESSRKRASWNNNRMAPDSAQVGTKRLRSFGQSLPARLAPTATLAVVIPDLGRDDLEARITAAASDAEAAISGGAIEPLFSQESGVKVKVEYR